MTSLPAPELVPAIRAALARNDARVQKITHAGRAVWIKRPERLGFLRRLQKGNALSAFEAERAGLHRLRDLGAPVPDLLAEGADFIALADSGPTLDTVLGDTGLSRDARLAAFAAAGRALADLHARGVSHGRPSLKDICWDGERIIFLDFERFSPSRNTPQGHAMDLVMFVFNGMAVGRGPTPEMAAALDSYRAHDPGTVWNDARAWCHRMRWLDWASKPIQWRRTGKSNEFKAIPATLAAFDTS